MNMPRWDGRGRGYSQIKLAECQSDNRSRWVGRVGILIFQKDFAASEKKVDDWLEDKVEG